MVFLELAGFPPRQGNISRCSYSVALESRAPLVPCRETPNLDSGAEPQEEIPQVSFETEEEVEDPQPVLASSCSSLDEAVMDTDVSSPQEDHKAYQDLLKWVALNLDIQAKMLKEMTHALLDILSAAGHSKVALPLNETIMDLFRVLWLIPASLPPTAKRTERKYCALAKGYEFQFSLSPPGSLVVVAINERDCQCQVGPTPKAKFPQKVDLFS